MLTIKVEDTGVGMTQKHIQGLFVRFNKLLNHYREFNP